MSGQGPVPHTPFVPAAEGGAGQAQAAQGAGHMHVRCTYRGMRYTGKVHKWDSECKIPWPPRRIAGYGLTSEAPQGASYGGDPGNQMCALAHAVRVV